MVPIHADPYDFQRWTNTKLVSELNIAKFDVIEIYQMGAFFDVIMDLFHHFLHGNRANRYILKLWEYCSKLSLLLLKPHFRRMGKFSMVPKIATGWFVIAKYVG